MKKAYITPKTEIHFLKIQHHILQVSLKTHQESDDPIIDKSEDIL